MRFLGVITYLSQFIPDLAKKTHSLPGLLKKTSEFRWDIDHQRDRTAPIIQKVDSSQKGLGAALMQHGKPVAFASKHSQNVSL